jgi:thiol:disulfide interchange protein DsbD
VKICRPRTIDGIEVICMKNWFMACACAIAAAVASLDSLAQEPDILRPEQAFAYTVTADAAAIALHFDLEDGYYLYRDRFSFASETPGVELLSPRFPAGDIHEDEFFGRQEIYRGRFDVTLPYRRSGAVADVEIALRLQGCADIGLCYPPQDWRAAVTLPPVAGMSAAPSSSFLPGAANDEPLPPEQAFVMNARFDAANELTVSWQIQPGYYLYRNQFEFAVDGAIELGTPSLPQGVALTDQNYGAVEVFYDYVEARIPFSRASPDDAPVTIRSVFQGCKEDSICYPPMEQSMALTVPATSTFDGTTSAAATLDAPISEQDFLARVILNDSMWIVLGTFYVLGLGLAFTPCVLPMIPILSSIIAGNGAVTPGKGFALSLSYVLGMAVTYTAAGAAAAMAGGQIQAMFQQPWIITLFAAMFVVLALGMFGMYELQMPSAIQSRVSALANKQRGGTFVGTAVMGALSALIVTACVAPPLIATLAVMGQSGDVVRGGSALFALSMGMGSPLLVVGASAGSILPRAGAWMNTVKAAFGVMMLGVAIWMMDRVLPASTVLVLWALLVFLSGVFLGAFDALPEHPAPSRRFAKGIGVLACLYGAMMLIGATLGGEDPLQPIPRGILSVGNAAATPAEQLEFRAIESVAELDTALAEARSAGRPVMIDFTADWCVSCREMEEYTFPEATVIAALEPFLLLRADVTANNDDDKALLSRFKSYGPPTIAFFDARGGAQDPYKLVGYVPAAEFAAHVGRVAAL